MDLAAAWRKCRLAARIQDGAQQQTSTEPTNSRPQGPIFTGVYSLEKKCTHKQIMKKIGQESMHSRLLFIVDLLLTFFLALGIVLAHR